MFIGRSRDRYLSALYEITYLVYLFAVYVDDLIIQLRQSGHGLHVGQLFIGRALHADDILLMSASCYGLYRN